MIKLNCVEKLVEGYSGIHCSVIGGLAWSVVIENIRDEAHSYVYYPLWRCIIRSCDD